MNLDQLETIASSRYLAWAMESANHPGLTLDCSEVEDQLYSLAADHGIKVFRSLPKLQRASANVMFRSIARSITDENMSRVREDLIKAIRIAAKLPVQNRLRYIRRALSAIGVYGEEKGLIKTVARTQTSIADSAATWIQSISDPDIWGYVLIAKFDARPSHRAMHGIRYPKKHKFWQKYFPPNGWNCRCRARPIRFSSRFARTRPFSGTPDVDPGFRFNPGKLILGVH